MASNSEVYDMETVLAECRMNYMSGGTSLQEIICPDANFPQVRNSEILQDQKCD